MAACILGGCTSSTTPKTTVSDRSVCETVQSDFFYPTIPATGETVPVSSAVRVEALLSQAHDARLRSVAPGLEQAIKTDDKAAMVTIFSNLSETVCPEVAGVPPAT
jgi:hypothetical protein